jgi:hypothetical protein
MWNGGIVPFGYKVVDKRLVPDRQKSQKLKKIFEIFAETESLGKTYHLLKVQQIFTNKGLPFSKPHLQSTLRNVIYIGKMQYANRIYQGRHQPLISEDLFNMVQKLRYEKIKKLRLYKDYPLAGLIQCSECSSYMTPCHTNKKKKGKTKRYYYYRCTKTFKRDWNSCETRQVSADRLEDYIFQNLERISHDKHYLDSLIFKLNNSQAGDRVGLEPSKVCFESAKISAEIFAQTLQHFVQILPEKKGIEKNLWAKKFIKKIDYSKEEISVSLYYKRGSEEENSSNTASGWVGAAAGQSLVSSPPKKITPINIDRGNHQDWLPGLVDVDNRKYMVII